MIDFIENNEGVYKSALTKAEIEIKDNKYILRTPEFLGHESEEKIFNNNEELNADLANFLIKWVTVDIGAGFHPDTSVDQYQPPLRRELRKQYTEILELGFEYLENPYETGLIAGFAAGIYGEGMTM